MPLENFFRVLSSKSILSEENDLFDVQMHTIEFPASGATLTRFYTIDHKFFACSAVCLDEQHNVLLIKIPRFPLRNNPDDCYSWELPGGRNMKEETPIQCIKRELREETGLTAEIFEPLLNGPFYPECSFGTEKLYLFFAHNIRLVGKPKPEREGFFEYRWFPMEEAIRMIFANQIKSSWTIIGLLASRLTKQIKIK